MAATLSALLAITKPDLSAAQSSGFTAVHGTSLFLLLAKRQAISKFRLAAVIAPSVFVPAPAPSRAAVAKSRARAAVAVDGVDHAAGAVERGREGWDGLAECVGMGVGVGVDVVEVMCFWGWVCGCYGRFGCFVSDAAAGFVGTAVVSIDDGVCDGACAVIALAADATVGRAVAAVAILRTAEPEARVYTTGVGCGAAKTGGVG